MRIDAETLVAGALASFCSAVGAGIAANLFKIPVRDSLVMVALALAGAAVGVLAGRYVWRRIADDFPGVVEAKKIKTRKRLPGEAFMAEMLQRPILMRRENGRILIGIDRTDVTELVISNRGKTALSQRFIDTQRGYYEDRDREIHQFIAGFSPKPAEHIQLNEKFKLRWASGGVLSVVTFAGRNWIPLFFRDIRPYGWNISLGSSERHFDRNNRVRNTLDYELTSPSRFIFREFLEETLIIQGAAASGANTSLRIITPFGEVREDEQRKIQFEAEHLALRESYDDMQISPHPGKEICSDPISTSISINKITCPDKEYPGESGVLVCFSLLDLGIEVVKLLKYRVPDRIEFLDGEILERFDGRKVVRELTRMPVALVSCEFLHSVFSRDITADGANFRYTLGTNPSIEINRGIPPQHIHMFEWDALKRLEVVQGLKKAVGLEKQRYTDWYDKFGPHFFDSQHRLSRQNASRLFTPATAKILNLFFNNTSPDTWENPA